MKKQYDFVSYKYSNGLRIFCSDNLFGVINEQNEIVLKPQYDKISFWANSIITIKNNSYGLFDTSGNTILDNIYNDITHASYTLSDNIFAAEKDGVYLLINCDANTRSSFQFEEVKAFINGYSLVKTETGFGIIDTNFNVIIPFIYEELTQINLIEIFNEPTLRAKRNGKVYIINYNHEILKELDFEDIAELPETHLIAVKKNNLWGIVDYNFKEVIKPTYDQIKMPFMITPLIQIRKGNFFGLISTSTDIVLEPIYDDIRCAINHLIVKKDKQFALFDLKGKQITDFKYTRLLFDLDYYQVTINDKCGILDSNGNEIIPPIYDLAKIQDDGYKVGIKTVTDTDWIWRYGICDNTGKLVSKIIYDEVFSINVEEKTAAVLMKNAYGDHEW